MQLAESVLLLCPMANKATTTPAGNMLQLLQLLLHNTILTLSRCSFNYRVLKKLNIVFTEVDFIDILCCSSVVSAGRVLTEMLQC